MGHHHQNFGSKAVLVELEGFFTIAVEIEVGMDVHCVLSLSIEN